jgi:hypothetical protein
MVSRSYAWIATNGGTWSLASNWDDLTDGIDPSLTTPGPQDSVTVMGGTAGLTTVITGQGNAQAAAFFNSVALTGNDSFGTLALGTGSSAAQLTIAASTTVSATTAALASGSLFATGAGAQLDVTGAVTLGAGQTGLGAALCNLDAFSGARLECGMLTLNASTASLYVDPASAIEVGQAGGAIFGALTIDQGAQLSGRGNANAYAALINNGTITAAGGDLLVGATTGSGALNIAAGAILTLNGATGAGQSLAFLGGQSTLAIATEFDQPQGAITGFAAGDGIDMLGSPISAATYAARGASTGILTLYYGNLVADTLTLLGSYAGNVFLTAGDGAGGTLITLAPETGGSGGPSPGTTNPDLYNWTALGGGNWNRAANWQDLTSGANPARVAPGVNNLVTIAASQTGSFAVITGPANAASLAITGDLAMSGTYAIGSLAIGTAGASQLNGVLDLLPTTAMTVTTAAVADGALSVTGSAALSIGGTLALGGGPAGIGLPITALSATAGGTVRCGALTLGGGAGNTVTTDPTSIIEIGTAGGAAAGAVTIDPGATLTGNGQVNPLGNVVDNGTIAAAGGVLTLGAVTGTGALTIGANATLVLDAATALPITMLGAGATLAVADELVALTGTITGFVTGNAIDIESDPITGVSASFTNGVTAITMYYGSTKVAHFALAGNYAGQRFTLVPDGVGGTELLTAPNNGGGGGGGQGNTDLLSWTQPGSGAWNRAGNWFDLTTNAAATAPPGTLDPVQIIGPTGNGLQTIGGPAACASLACFGNTLLNGAFTAGTLTIGGEASGSTTLTAGSLNLASASNVTVTNAASILDGAIVVANPTGALTVSGTLTLGGGAPDAAGPAALLSAIAGGVVQLAGLSLGGGSGDTLDTDRASSIEIGTLGAAAAGAVTIDPGMLVAGNGQINQGGLTIDNGTLTAQGGTLVVGAVSGTGTLSINAAATLALTGAETCPIDMTGAGAILLLEGSLETPAAPIEGFVQGDFIVTGSSQIGAVAYQPGTGNIGTLTLYNGSEVAGTLLLAGNFASDVFMVEPDGAGSAITVQANGGGPSPGTTTPDDYVWLGATAGNWNTAANWSDVSAGQNPAAIAPGINDIVTITGGATAYTTITGPANAASLTLLGKTALAGIYAVGELVVGSAASAGMLALGAGSTLQAAQATVDGGVLARGGSLTVTGTLALQSGALLATVASQFEIATLLLTGTGDDVSVDANSSLEVGAAGVAAVGDITVDAGAQLAGAGVLVAQAMIIDEGTITAAGIGATLSLGAVSGAGTLLVGVGATMVLQGAAAPALLIDFAGPGTLTVTSIIPQAGIAGFVDGDAIDLPIAGITSATYAATAPNVGILTLDAGNQAVASLTLVGVGQDQSFSVAGAAGGTVITTNTESYGGGGSTMRNAQPTSGGGTYYAAISTAAFFQNLPNEVPDATYVQNVLSYFQETVDGGGEGSSYVYYSPDGGSFGDYQPQYANIAVTYPPEIINGDDNIVLPPGYDALLAQGNAALHLNDRGAGNALIVGNAANDTIVGLGADDTLIGGLNGNSVIWAQASATVYGGGNDTIVTNNGPCDVTTASRIGTVSARSVVFLGPAEGNSVTLSGADILVAAGVPGASSDDTVTAIGADTIFAQSAGLLTFNGGDAADIVVGVGGSIGMNGGTGNGTALWCDNSARVNYNGGAGSANIIGGTGLLSVKGGAGAITVYGGTGFTTITGAAGPSQFLVGDGASSVQAASGNLVWLVGAANDTLVADGGGSTIWGAYSSGNSTFQSGAGPCVMSGGSGNDTFWGGAGADSILAGSGADVFGAVAGFAGGAMTIYSFNTANDQIDLKGYTAPTSTLVGGNEVLSLNDGTSITLEGITSLAHVTINLS